MPRLNAKKKISPTYEDHHILRAVHDIYHNTLCSLAMEVDVNLIVPRRKVVVMLVGNHSSGKSSFINWYMGNKRVNKTGVACESLGFNICTRGNSDQIDEAIEVKVWCTSLAL